MVEGNTEIRIDRDEKMVNLRKKLQILMIKVWSLKAEQNEDMFYTLDKFEVASLYAPVEKIGDEVNDPNNTSRFV